MKRQLFAILFLFIGIGISTVQAEVIKRRANSYAWRIQNDYGYWEDWSKWEDSNVLIVIDIDHERITIYSQETQEYDIYSWGDEVSDGQGGTMWENKAIDANGLRCSLRFRTQSNGIQQLYVDYSDMSWVYSLE